jgi:hypothetical protein
MSVDPMSYFNAKKSAGAQEKGANAAAAAQREAIEASNQMYDTSRADFRQFMQPSGYAMASLNSAAQGSPQQYADPSYQYDRATGKYIGPDGQSVDQAPMLSASYQPTESEGFKYTKQRTLADLGRQLRMMGRGSGTTAANAMGRTLGDLNASNEDRYYNQLLNLAKIGQGAAGSTTTAGQATTSANNSAYGNIGNAALMAGQAKASLYSGLSGANASGMAGGMQMANYFRNQNYGGGGGGGGYSGGYTGSAPAGNYVMADQPAYSGNDSSWFGSGS